MSCTEHKRYRAIRKPRVPCEDCWRMYITKQDQEMMKLAKSLVAAHPLLCEQSIPGHHLEECVRKYGHDGYCSSASSEHGR